MAPHAQEAAGSDNGVRNCLVRRDDDVVDRSDGFSFVVEDLPSEKLAFGAPACCDVPKLGIGRSQLRRTNNLLGDARGSWPSTARSST
jgi:hypothetical protein